MDVFMRVTAHYELLEAKLALNLYCVMSGLEEEAEFSEKSTAQDNQMSYISMPFL